VKHWHKCKRYTDQGLQCPYDAQMELHLELEDEEGDDDELTPPEQEKAPFGRRREPSDPPAETGVPVEARKTVPLPLEVAQEVEATPKPWPEPVAPPFYPSPIPDYPPLDPKQPIPDAVPAYASSTNQLFPAETWNPMTAGMPAAYQATKGKKSLKKAQKPLTKEQYIKAHAAATLTQSGAEMANAFHPPPWHDPNQNKQRIAAAEIATAQTFAKSPTGPPQAEPIYTKKTTPYQSHYNPAPGLHPNVGKVLGTALGVGAAGGIYINYAQRLKTLLGGQGFGRSY